MQAERRQKMKPQSTSDTLDEEHRGSGSLRRGILSSLPMCCYSKNQNHVQDVAIRALSCGRKDD